jgi:hypothetical protein
MGKNSDYAEAWRDCYDDGLTPAEACNFVWFKDATGD